jgi:hypothetical protein
MTTIESHQDVLDGKISSVLTIVDANTETLSKLKSMLAKFMGNPKVPDNGSLSKSKSAVEHRIEAPVHIIVCQAAKTSSIPKVGTVINHTKDVRLNQDEELKQVSPAVAVPTGTTWKMPTTTEKSPMRDKEVTTAAETLEFADSFLDLENAGGNSANADLVAAEALARISSPIAEVEAIKPTAAPKIASEGKEIQKISR